MQRPARRGLRLRVSGKLAEADAGLALSRLTAWGWNDPPWQLEPASLAHLPAFEIGGEAVAFGKSRGDRFWLYALSVAPDRRRRGLARRVCSLLPGVLDRRSGARAGGVVGGRGAAARPGSDDGESLAVGDAQTAVG